jgi:hypothetical protein
MGCDDRAGVGLCPPVPADQLCMSFVPVGGKSLGIQIATSGKARLLRTFFGAILALMRLECLSVDLAQGLVQGLVQGSALLLHVRAEVLLDEDIAGGARLRQDQGCDR